MADYIVDYYTEGWDLFNRFYHIISMCLSEDRTWISTDMCRDLLMFNGLMEMWLIVLLMLVEWWETPTSGCGCAHPLEPLWRHFRSLLVMAVSGHISSGSTSQHLRKCDFVRPYILLFIILLLLLFLIILNDIARQMRKINFIFKTMICWNKLSANYESWHLVLIF